MSQKTTENMYGKIFNSDKLSIWYGTHQKQRNKPAKNEIKNIALEPFIFAVALIVFWSIYF